MTMPDEFRTTLQHLAEYCALIEQDLQDLQDSAYPAAASSNAGARPIGPKGKPPCSIVDLDYIIEDVAPRIKGWCFNLQESALAPATWYVEKGKRFALPDGETFGIASITTTAQTDDGDMLTYAVVTRDAVEQAATVHPRMPLILPRELHDDWLDPTIPGDGDLLAEAIAASEQVSRQVRIT